MLLRCVPRWQGRMGDVENNDPIKGATDMGIRISNGLVVRGIAVALAIVPALGFMTGTGHAAWKPTKDVEILVTVGPGSGPDQIARLLQGIWKKHGLLDVDTVVVNKPGGGGAVAWNYFNGKYAGDGHSIAIGGASMISNSLTGRSEIGFKQLTPLVHLISEYIAIAVNPDSPIKTGTELLEKLKADPQSLSLGIATSKGNSNHQGIAIPAKKQGIKISQLKTVIFQSGGKARTALMGGHIDVVPTSVGSMFKQVEAGKLRAVAVASPKRLGGVMADVPTWKELGVDAVVANWRGIIGPKDMPAEAIAFWEDVFAKTVETEEWKKSLETRYQIGELLRHEQFLAYCEEQEAAIKDILMDLGLIK